MSKHRNDSKMHGENTASSENPKGASVAPDTAAGSAMPTAGSAPESKANEFSGSENPSGSLTAELEAARAQVASLREEVGQLNEKYLRKLADEVNFRKRMIREKEEAQKYAVASLLGDLIPILDDFDRGIASVESTKNYEQLSEGVILIKKQLSQMLENKYALKRFESKGTLFDPNRHEAVFAEPADIEDPVVAEEYLPGYSLHDRILRTAKVRVKIPAPGKPAGAANATGEKVGNDGAGSAAKADQA